ncbi:hypothetical protein G7046_g6203 [Stylonectria norvegica]|nr:hypothetical protein G7046_g6203 [Stylonectria norvegica]
MDFSTVPEDSAANKVNMLSTCPPQEIPASNDNTTTPAFPQDNVPKTAACLAGTKCITPPDVHVKVYYPCAQRYQYPVLFNPCETVQQGEHDQVRKMTLAQAQDFCKKLVPVYGSPKVSGHVRRWLLNWWHWCCDDKRIAHDGPTWQVILPTHMPKDMERGPLVNLTISMNAVICTKANEIQNKHLCELRSKDMKPQGEGDLGFHVRPLFRALFILFHKAYDKVDLRRDNPQELPVIVVLTGHTMGLSAPISLESLKPSIISRVTNRAVEVPLGAAIRFVQFLARREANSRLPKEADSKKPASEENSEDLDWVNVEMPAKEVDEEDDSCVLV